MLHGNLVNPITSGDELLIGFDIGAHDFRIGAFAPHALEQNDAVRPQISATNATEQDLLVERYYQIRFVAAVGDAARPETDTVAARTSDAARRRPYLSGNDLHGPHAVAHLRSDAAKRLSAALRSFAGVADDLDHVFVQC